MIAISKRVALLKRLAAMPRPLALVPTMGALHAGHASLVRRARRAAGPNGTVAVTIFVNPAQFGPKEDLGRYPRTLRTDLEICEKNGADLVFHPTNDQIYSADHSTWVEEENLSRGHCGKTRPGHFRGVCTVVLKLFNLFQPEIAIFGRKDYQQLAVIQRMVRDLDLRIKIIGAPTIREKDGLAMSSRNHYLSREERMIAPHFRAALLEVGQVVKTKKIRPAEAGRLFKSLLKAGGPFEIDYFEVVNPDTLEPAAPDRNVTSPVVMLAAVYLGKTRLIDNLELL